MKKRYSALAILFMLFGTQEVQPATDLAAPSFLALYGDYMGYGALGAAAGCAGLALCHAYEAYELGALSKTTDQTTPEEQDALDKTLSKTLSALGSCALWKIVSEYLFHASKAEKALYILQYMQQEIANRARNFEEAASFMNFVAPIVINFAKNETANLTLYRCQNVDY